MNTANVTALNLEMNGIRDRTRKAMGVSAILHLLLILFLVFYSKVVPGPEVITEILWVEPEEVQMAAAAHVTETKPEKQVHTAKAKEPVHFERVLKRAEVEPHPQSERAVSDKLNERLASLQESAVQRASLSPVNVNVPVPSRPALAAAEPAAGPPRELKHAEPAKGNPVELRRIRERTPVPVTAAVATPSVSRPTRAENPNAVQNLAGMTLVGPVADRKVLAYASPRYPEWAKREAVEGSVRLHFVVLADGAIKENVMVQKTSGYEDFDGNATAALKTWKFEPLGRGESGEQWGEITFNYRLNAGE